jgi:hypothetical protein
MERGLALLDDETSPRAQRLRVSRDFYAFVEREVPKLLEQFKNEYFDGKEGQRHTSPTGSSRRSRDLKWTRDVSPWHWSGGAEALKHGLQAGNSLLLLATTAVLVALGI